MKRRELSGSDRKAIRAWLAALSEGTNDGRGPYLDYPRIGEGKHRIVYDLGDGRVLKVASAPKGIECNAQEAALYREAPPALRKHLCPVLDDGRGWLVMKKMTKRFPRDRKYERRLRRVLELGETYGLRISDIYSRRTGKPRRNNIRITSSGRVVLIDYANVYATDGNRIVSFFRRPLG